jgi:SAM-dependent methyltransferase
VGKAVGGAVLALGGLAPGILGEWFLRRHRFYQAPAGADLTRTPGDSGKKWEAISAICSFGGKQVLDIGCAEGFFCRSVARAGASGAVGVDSRVKVLLAAKFLDRRERFANKPTYRLGTFPNLGLKRRFDRVLCLSVLHHTVSTPDILPVLSDPSFIEDLTLLRANLCRLRDLLAPGGVCVIEMPYEFANEELHRGADYERLVPELIAAGYSNARIAGTWDHSRKDGLIKDRILYACDA